MTAKEQHKKVNAKNRAVSVSSRGTDLSVAKKIASSLYSDSTDEQFLSFGGLSLILVSINAMPFECILDANNLELNAIVRKLYYYVMYCGYREYL